MHDSDEIAKDDFEYTREVYHNLLAKGSEALDDMMEVARMSEHPRAFEVLSTMMKSIADINGSLIDMHKKKKDFYKKETKTPELPNGTVNNNLFVGSTTELQRMLQDMSQKSDSNVIDITSKLPNDNESK
jgi:hypothetical protein